MVYTYAECQTKVIYDDPVQHNTFILHLHLCLFTGLTYSQDHLL